MPTETPTRDAKLVQYLNEAYALERRLETNLQAHIGEAQRDALKKRLKEHHKETRQQIKAIERRIKALGGKAEAVDLPGPDAVGAAAGAVAGVAQKGVALAKGPMHAIRGASVEETELKNAKSDFREEHEEIATYDGIEALATALGDKETAKLAKDHRRQEERMATFLKKQIGQLAKAVATKEVPSAERRAATGGSSSRRSSTSTSRSGSSRSANGRSGGSSSSKSGGSKSSASKSGASKSSGSSSRSTSRSTSSRSSGSKSSGSSASKSGGSRSGASKSSGSKSSGSSSRSTSRSTSSRSSGGSSSKSGGSSSRSSSRSSGSRSKSGGSKSGGSGSSS